MTIDNANLKRMNRIAKLMTITIENGATPGEAQNAKELAEQMMAEYNITQADILKNVTPQTIGREKCRIVVVDTIKCGSMQATTHALAGPVAKFCDVKYWYNKGHYTYAFYGLPSDAQSAGYLFEALGNQIVEAFAKYKESEAYSKERLHGFTDQQVRSAFLRGAEEVLADRLIEMWKAKNNIVEKAKGTALMVVKQDLIVADFKDFSAETGLKLKSGGERYKDPGSAGALKAGKDAGRKAHIGQGLDDHSNSPDTRRLK